MKKKYKNTIQIYRLLQRHRNLKNIPSELYFIYEKHSFKYVCKCRGMRAEVGQCARRMVCIEVCIKIARKYMTLLP